MKFEADKFKQNESILIKLLIFSGIQPLIDILEQYGGWPVVKGDEWESDDWNWLEMSKNMSTNGLPANFILEASVGPDLENTSKNILKVWN